MDTFIELKIKVVGRQGRQTEERGPEDLERTIITTASLGC